MSTPSDQLDTITVTSHKPSAPVAPGTQQYGRQLSLIVADKSGAGLELNQFRVVFHVNRGDYQNPNTADIRVYNLSRKTANQLAAKEFTQLRPPGRVPRELWPDLPGHDHAGADRPGEPNR